MKKIKILSPILVASSLTCMLPLTACNYKANKVTEDEWKEAFTKLCSIDGTTNWAAKEDDYIKTTITNTETGETSLADSCSNLSIAADGCCFYAIDEDGDKFCEYNVKYGDLFLHYRLNDGETKTVDFGLCTRDDRHIAIFKTLSTLKDCFYLYYNDMKFNKKTKSYTFNGKMGEAITLKSSVRFDDKKISNIQVDFVLIEGNEKLELTCNLNPQYGQASINQEAKAYALKHVVVLDKPLDQEQEITFANIGDINETEGFIIDVKPSVESKYLTQNLTEGSGHPTSIEVFNSCVVYRNGKYTDNYVKAGFRFLSFESDPLKTTDSLVILIRPTNKYGKPLYKEPSIKFTLTNTEPSLP